MPALSPTPDLWPLVLDSLSIDPADLAAAVDAECLKGALDFRTRLLIRDALTALGSRSGLDVTLGRLSAAAQVRARAVLTEDLGDVRFPSLQRRLVDHTRPDKIRAFLRELGAATRAPARIDVGGSSALILRGLLDRFTEDIDAVDEVPAVVRTQYALIDRLVERYNLRLTHFQSHYLPDGWAARAEYLDTYGELGVYLLDPIDLIVGKLFSRREKDLDDVRVVRPRLDWTAVVDRLRSSAGPLRADAKSLAAAERNWYVLTGDPLPPP